MEKLINEIYDKNNGFWYKRYGNYYFPEYYLGKGLSLEKATRLKDQRVKEDTENNTKCCENVILGKYGRARLNYIKTHKRGLYAELLMNVTLNKHLAEIDEQSNVRVKQIVEELAKTENVDESLKQNNQLEWVGLLNNFKNQAEEIVYNEIIFS